MTRRRGSRAAVAAALVVLACAAVFLAVETARVLSDPPGTAHEALYVDRDAAGRLGVFLESRGDRPVQARYSVRSDVRTFAFGSLRVGADAVRAVPLPRLRCDREVVVSAIVNDRLLSLPFSILGRAPDSAACRRRGARG